MDSMKKLLSEWKFDDTIIENFLRHKITEDHLEKLTDAYINELIPAIGDRITFIKNREILLQLKRKSNDKKKIDVKEIIKRSEVGRNIYAVYEVEGVEEFLGHEQRMQIIDIILDEVFEKKITLSRNHGSHFDDISNQILTVFPNELKEFYYEPHHGGQPMGLLYQRYFERRPNQKNKNENEVSLQDQVWNCLTEDGVQESIAYLKEIEHNDKDILRQHWEKTLKVRKLKIKMSKQFDEILHDWPHLRERHGILLIDHDFTAEHGEECAMSLRTKWYLFFEKIFRSLRDAIKDLKGKRKFVDIENEEDLSMATNIQIGSSFGASSKNEYTGPYMDTINNRFQEFFF